MSRKIESLMIPGPAGRLEALLEEPETAEPIAAALVCHPHPQYGGTMHTRAVHRTARGLRKAGAVVLRFNYRGVNLSEGEYDHGKGEIDDAHVCLNLLIERYPSLPYCIAGFSFGSRIALKVALDSPDAQKVIAIGYPTKYPDPSFIAQVPVPRVFIQSTNDEHGPKADLDAFVATLPQPTKLIYIEAQDHFFVGALDAFEQAVADEGPLRRLP